jgi:5-methylcytosine-specific restriction endonuclease McrA
MDPDFLEQAYQLRHRYFSDKQSDLSLKPSHYNARKLCGVCELCKTNMGEEMHHIQYQQHANKEDGYMADGSFHKNNLANLMSVCRDCHDAYHRKHDDGNTTTKKKMIRSKTTTKGYIIREDS